MSMSAKEARDFILAGRATFTMKSKKSGAYYTLRVNASTGPKEIYFVKLLTAPETYTYLGIIEPPQFRTTGKSSMNEDSTPVKAVKYLCRHVLEQNNMPDDLEVMHEGHCGRCGRTLTHPISLKNGLGPECQKYLGL